MKPGAMLSLDSILCDIKQKEDMQNKVLAAQRRMHESWEVKRMERVTYIDGSGEGLCAPGLLRSVCSPKSDRTASSGLSGDAHPAVTST